MKVIRQQLLVLSKHSFLFDFKLFDFLDKFSNNFTLFFLFFDSKLCCLFEKEILILVAESFNLGVLENEFIFIVLQLLLNIIIEGILSVLPSFHQNFIILQQPDSGLKFLILFLQHSQELLLEFCVVHRWAYHVVASRGNWAHYFWLAFLVAFRVYVW